MNQTTAQLRRQSDRSLIEALQERSGGQLEILSSFDQQAKHLRLRAALPSAKNDNYPNEQSSHIGITISFPPRYPFEQPTAKVDTPIFHPNVFANMTICLGTQWSISEGLDLFVARILRLLTFDPQLVNIHSAANGAAARWYKQLSTRQSTAFPAATRAQAPWIYEPRVLQTSAQPISDSTAQAKQRKIIHCPQCQQNIRLPTFPQGFKSGLISCPACKTDLTVDQYGNCSPS